MNRKPPIRKTPKYNTWELTLVVAKHKGVKFDPHPQSEWINFCATLSINARPKPTAKARVHLQVASGRLKWQGTIKERISRELVQEVESEIKRLSQWSVEAMENHPINKIQQALKSDGF